MKRIEGLDGIRGWLLIAMTVNHLVWISNGNTPLQWLTLQPFGQVGAAEGFVFISGLLAGMIYSADTLTNAQITRKAWRRALTIYGYHIACLIVVYFWYHNVSLIFSHGQANLSPNVPNFISAPFHATWLSALLLNRPAYFDILPLYILFMLLLPALIVMFKHNLTLPVLASSIGLWLCSGYIEQEMLAPLYTVISPELVISVGYFDPFAWQLLFIVGSALGYHHCHHPVNWFKHTWVTYLVCTIAILLFAAHYGAFLSQGLHPGILYSLADKPELGWLRLLSLSVWIYLVGRLINVYPKVLNIRGLSLLGRHSLQVFAWQSILIFIAAPTLITLRATDSYHLIILLLVMTLFIPALINEASHQRQWSPTKAFAITSSFLFAVTLSSKVLETTLLPQPIIYETVDYPLNVKLENLKKGDTPITVLVYGENDDLMGLPTVFSGVFPVEAATQSISLGELPAGKYVVFAMQDIDNNGRLSFSRSGIPTEPFGYSNNPSLSGPPTIDVVGYQHTSDDFLHIKLMP